jgi:hypothetical protein
MKDIPTPSRRLELALSADDTAVIVLAHQSTLLVEYLQTYFNNLKHGYGTGGSPSASRIWPQCFSLTREMQPKAQASTANPVGRYSSLSGGWPLTHSWPDRLINQVGRKTTQRLGILDPHLKRTRSWHTWFKPQKVIQPNFFPHPYPRRGAIYFSVL